ncbi:AmmeMemoRadiSam system protein B [Patescibacteria group bacterium]|nr:AmmeMemoRadiSam system protein B [Patescibacteria group bacterium]
MKHSIWITALAAFVLTTSLVAVLSIVFYTRVDTNPTLASFGEILNINADDFKSNTLPTRFIDNKAPQLVDQAFETKYDWTVPKDSRIILVPHHMVAAREVASLLKATPEPKIIYFLMPDHFSAGRSALTTSESNWQTSSGKLEIDYSKIQQLTASLPELGINDQAMSQEIASQALFPYIVKAWPDAKIVPIMFNNDLTPDIRVSLANALVQELENDQDAILLATVDFSHYMPVQVADFHDELANDVLQSLADLEVDKIELDSANVLGTALKVARTMQLGQVTIYDHTNSLKLLNLDDPADGTSHFFVSFSPGEINTQQTVSLLFLGDMMFDRTVATRSNASGSLSYPFAKISGQEDRFFKGQDFVIGNLEGPVTDQRRAPDKGEVDFMFNPKIASVLKNVGIDAVSQANNHTLDQGRLGAEQSHQYLNEAGLVAFGDQVNDDAESSLAILESRGQKVAVLGFNITDNALDKQDALEALRIAKEKSDYQVVYIHWGAEYQAKPNQSQIDLAHWFIDNSVDAVIGAHPHWMQSVEVYNNSPIVYSLGNFIFDQDWSVETNKGLTVGLVFSEKGTAVHLMPIQITKSQPAILVGLERQNRLNRLAEISDESIAEQIKSGILKNYK